MYSLFIIIKLFSQNGNSITSFKAGEYVTQVEALNAFKDLDTNGRSDISYIIIKS